MQPLPVFLIIYLNQKREQMAQMGAIMSPQFQYQHYLLFYSQAYCHEGFDDDGNTTIDTSSFVIPTVEVKTSGHASRHP